MSLQTYAVLDPTQATVIGFETVDTMVYPTLAAAKQAILRPVTITAQPGFNAVTQGVVQNGWTVNPTDVEPIWVIVSLPATEVTWNQALALNLVTAFNTYAATAVPSQAATNAVVLNLVKCVSALLQDKYNVSS